jgi:endo-1,4-beta-xylanase
MLRVRVSVLASCFVLAACAGDDDVDDSSSAFESAAFIRPAVLASSPLDLKNPNENAVTWPVWGASFSLRERVGVRAALEASDGAGLTFGGRADPEAKVDETTAVALAADARGWTLRELRGSVVLQETHFDGPRALSATLRFEVGRVVVEAAGAEHVLTLRYSLPESSGTYVSIAPRGALKVSDITLTQALPTTPHLGAPLRQLANGLAFGTATDVWPPLHDAYFESLLAEQFDTLAATELYWPTTRGEDRDLFFVPADLMVNFATVHGQKAHGYFLTWDFELPGWLSELPRDKVGDVLDEHIDTLVSRYRDRIGSWVVANEAILGPEDMDGKPAAFAPSLWTQAMGPDYIARAFRRAHAADPRARLLYNETGAESLGPKSDFMFEMVKRLLSEGVPIHGVGFQSHLDAKKLPDRASFRANLERFANLGIDVAITEPDVSLEGMKGTREENEALQASVYREVLAMCRAIPRCRSFTVFGFTDAYAWDELGDASPLIFDKAYRAKPAFYALQTGLRAAAN